MPDSRKRDAHDAARKVLEAPYYAPIPDGLYKLLDVVRAVARTASADDAESVFVWAERLIGEGKSATAVRLIRLYGHCCPEMLSTPAYRSRVPGVIGDLIVEDATLYPGALPAVEDWS